MLTKNDIAILKEILATKEDIRDLKDEINGIKAEMNGIKKELNKRPTKEDLKKEIDDNNEILLSDLVEVLTPLMEKVEAALDENRTHRIIFGDFEKQIQELKKNLKMIIKSP